MRARIAAVTWLLTGWALSAVAGPVMEFSRTSIDFGYQPLAPVAAPYRDAQRVILTNPGDAPLLIRTVGIGGLNADNFALGDGTCVAGTVVLPGQRCTFEIVAHATVARALAQLEFTTEESPVSPITVALTVRGLTVGGTYRYLRPVPRVTEFDEQTLYTSSAARPIVVTNVGTETFGLDGVVINGRDAASFDWTSDCFPGINLAVGKSCTISVVYTPTTGGRKYAELVVLVSERNLPVQGTFRIPLSALTPSTDHPSGSVRVVEFYNPALDHYFMSALAPDIQALDSQVFPGWERTGAAFYAYPKLFAGLSPVCRFYLPPPYGNSHFYSASPDECAQVRATYPQFSYESPNVMYIALPDLATGACANGSNPVYRVFNNRADGNHRYVTDLALRDAFVARGYLAEGYGPDGVIMCSAP